ncbi:cytochrome d ubiquinol oxidase subunit II [Arthrobacter sp. N199823]|uniref:cytochrome d ubiquinol oxidase subunit II n=1 Tax=Arthrobacter sp. N199823 TaxID=2058895 RepID=UPI0011B061DD|nr:cytochrome d ubiquinol oxidase subunit II [Arthrobacter sp. N199823]
MKRDEFDARYPAMFQPGGEDHDFRVDIPQAAPQNSDHASFRAPQAPRDVRATAVRAREARATEADARAGSGEQLSEHAIESTHRPQPEAREGHTRHFSSNDNDHDHDHDHEHEHEHEYGEHEEHHHFASPLTRRVSRWSARSWVVASLAILVVFAGSAFCLFATFLIPSSASPNATAFHDVLVIPWGNMIFPGGPAFLAAGLGMFAAMFLLAARHYPTLAWRFQAVAALGGLVTLGIGLMAVFSEHLFSQLLYKLPNYQENSNPLQWYTVFALTAVQLMILGPIILALVVVLRPGRKGTPGTVTPKTTFWTGTCITAAGVWAWCTPQLFPLARGTTVKLMEGQQIETMPWTYNLSQTGGPLILVGTAVLFWWVLILATSHRVLVETTPVETGSDDAGPLETAEGSYIQGPP